MTIANTGRPDGVGAPLKRREDFRLITGRGAYVSDAAPAGHATAAFVRSLHAHAEIRSIDAAAALAAPGVLAVLTGADAIADGLQPIPHNPDWKGPPDAELKLPPGYEVFVSENRAMPADRARYVGEPLAMVIAETPAAAASAAELVDIDYAPLPAVIDANRAMAPDAPEIWPERPDNVALACEVGDKAATDRAFAEAAHVVSFKNQVNRITGSPMEPRAAIGEYDAEADRYAVRAASGRGAVQTRERLAVVLGVEKERCRVHFGDMGGNFGTRNAFSPEFALVAWAAKRVGRPVKWTGDRSECFLSDYQGRDLSLETELALDAEGRFLAMRGRNVMNLGAYSIYFWPLRKGLSMMQGTYAIPAVHFEGRAAFTNTPPIAVYRSAGRPEAIYAIERLIDLAALECGFDRVELRRKNLITSDRMPYQNAVGVTYDSGDYPLCMQNTLRLADWDGYGERKAASAAHGRLRGRAVANYIEVTSGIPRERAELKVLVDGDVELVVGTASSGQGHETTFPQLVAEWLDIPMDRVRFVANDTDRVSVGGGSHSGRSMRLVSIAVGEAAEELLALGKKAAARALQAPEEDIVYAGGRFAAPNGASLDLAAAAEAARALSGDGLAAAGDVTNRAGGYPYGTHACEVEVDPETGVVDIVKWSGVDDVGLAINPLVLDGQAHGAIAQGLGQALLEDIRYDPETAQLLTGSFMDYAMPRADNTPPMAIEIMEIPASSHPHGVRPGGEGGTTPALGLVVNAVVDALAHLGVRDIQMPTTPERVWRAIQAGTAKGT